MGVGTVMGYTLLLSNIIIMMEVNDNKNPHIRDPEVDKTILNDIKKNMKHLVNIAKKWFNGPKELSLGINYNLPDNSDSNDR